MGGGTPAVKETTASSSKTADPMAAGYFPGVYDMGKRAVDASQGVALPTDFVAGATPGQRSGVSQLYAAAPNLGMNAQSMSDMARKVSTGFFLDPSNDPTFAGAADAAITPITRALTEKVLPGITNNNIVAGGIGAGPSAYGGAAQRLDTQGALTDWETTAGGITSQMANNSRNAGLALLPQAGKMTADANATALAPGVVTGQAGSTEQALNQSSIDNLLAKYKASVAQPWTGLQDFANLLTTGGFNSGTAQSTETSTPAQASLATQLLQGGLGVAGAAGSLFGAPTGGTAAATTIANMFKGLMPTPATA